MPPWRRRGNWLVAFHGYIGNWAELAAERGWRFEDSTLQRRQDRRCLRGSERPSVRQVARRVGAAGLGSASADAFGGARCHRLPASFLASEWRPPVPGDGNSAGHGRLGGRSAVQPGRGRRLSPRPVSRGGTHRVRGRPAPAWGSGEVFPRSRGRPADGRCRALETTPGGTKEHRPPRARRRGPGVDRQRGEESGAKDRSRGVPQRRHGFVERLGDAGIARRNGWDFRTGAFRPYSNIYPGLPCDETPFIQAILDFTGVDGELVDTSTVLASDYLETLCGRIDHPHLPNALPVELVCAAAAADSHSVLLTGLGGDEWLGGSLDYIRELFYSGRMITALHDLWRVRLPSRLGGFRRKIIWLSPQLGLAKRLGFRRTANGAGPSMLRAEHRGGKPRFEAAGANESRVGRSRSQRRGW